MASKCTNCLCFLFTQLRSISFSKYALHIELCWLCYGWNRMARKKNWVDTWVACIICAELVFGLCFTGFGFFFSLTRMTIKIFVSLIFAFKCIFFMRMWATILVNIIIFHSWLKNHRALSLLRNHKLVIAQSEIISRFHMNLQLTDFYQWKSSINHLFRLKI